MSGDFPFEKSNLVRLGLGILIASGIFTSGLYTTRYFGKSSTKKADPITSTFDRNSSDIQTSQKQLDGLVQWPSVLSQSRAESSFGQSRAESSSGQSRAESSNAGSSSSWIYPSKSESSSSRYISTEDFSDNDEYIPIIRFSRSDSKMIQALDLEGHFKIRYRCNQLAWLDLTNRNPKEHKFPPFSCAT